MTSNKCLECIHPSKLQRLIYLKPVKTELSFVDKGHNYHGQNKSECILSIRLSVNLYDWLFWVQTKKIRKKISLTLIDFLYLFSFQEVVYYTTLKHSHYRHCSKQSHGGPRGRCFLITRSSWCGFEPRSVLLAGVSCGFSRGSPVFAPPTDWPVSYELK